MQSEIEIVLPASRARFVFSARTDVGRERKINEDSFLAQSPIFLVADGMGGHAHGDVASQTVVRVFDEHIARDTPSTPERILDAIHSSNDAVRDLSAVDDYGTAVSGTTLAGVAFVDAGDDVGFHWMAFNIGDSRVYTWDGRTLTQLSVDHSAVQEMVDAGLISAVEAEHHPERNVITRAIGADESVDADVWLLPARGRHSFLICSDGLTKELGTSEIARLLAAYDGTAETERSLADVLVDAALARGGHDNVTVVYIESVLDDPGQDADDDSTRDRATGMHEHLEDTRPRSQG
ncbi:serine/threonine-protein phosphatase [Cryobacterium sp. TMT1-21]|uniref:Serine/threonine-protein phosphatase n=1 Tax=Cryobacterium shii TaxID=1259235 RepID=A0AAQ2C3L7_9MICO|nr:MULTISPECIES: protein phosphatase 2C domain-containing protein [Cryobacterium]TFC40988.1 serine/threonine-protein phosphatase [Cryobacterium shii]TFC87825.1 serine/threonine-protein phosphatase [Cryobacterium sp. TmT2-59]TFD12465.1 serine/threonine-protein phosphatase [Cryobacterium sp. TMT1-21]TFD19407.1 serine/threonine-protein phosphatase [Cryobacterium sp. TMT2-23]TFD19908.1 serine/threonine-protein phosphatase [Cryobacterium sp. TMT4-10]